MTLKERPKTLPHLFMPGETVSAVIKKMNKYDVTGEEMQVLLAQFKDINPGIPRPGVRALIPILTRHQTEIFKD